MYAVKTNFTSGQVECRKCPSDAQCNGEISSLKGSVVQIVDGELKTGGC